MTSAATHSRFSSISAAPPDPILGLSEAFAADPNPDKMNLSVGVYKDADGRTPILDCVREAERRMVDAQATKGYLPIDGPATFAEHVRRLVFPDSIAADRVATVQSPGGTGGLRVAASLIADQMSGASVWLPNPTWANHKNIFAAEKLNLGSYRYLGEDRTSLDAAAMLEDLQKVPAGDVVLLHACCHNPTGIDPTEDQWRQIAAVLAQRGALPLIDFAYQGFGEGVEADRRGIEIVLDACDEAIVCNSFSKNFGLYSERVGGVTAIGPDASGIANVRSQMKRLIRSNYSNPPRHGGEVVVTILDDDSLTQQWRAELEAMRVRIDRIRNQFVDAMAAGSRGKDFEFLRRQRGMFSFSGLTPMQVDELRSRYAIYIVGSGRINVAGIDESRMDYLCDAVADVTE